MATKGGSIQEAAAAAAQIYRNNYWRGGEDMRTTIRNISEDLIII